jgi:DNA (cytosine-5)-methyltransferase 1
MGTALAGFKAQAVIEWDRWACDTIKENKVRGFPLVMDWPLHRGDVRDFDYRTLPEGIDLVSGGPPCQPFSIGGKHAGYKDSRDMFSAMAAIVRQLKPRAFIVENVRGLTRPKFANYFQYILDQFAMPDIAPRDGEKWHDHLARLEREKTSGRDQGLKYEVNARLLNAADYGAPQKRERVFIVGFRSDQPVEWSFPDPTHSQDMLLREQWITGDYWDRHRISRTLRGEMPHSVAGQVDRRRKSNSVAASGRLAWRSVRDALVDLPKPRKDGKAVDGFLNHRFQPGARVYKGHTGCPLDQPAKTLKAGDHGVPGGENMMVLPSGEVRYFTVREAARLQTFADGYTFHGAWSETMRQLGNAVPVVLAQRVASSVAVKLLEAEQRQLIGRRGAA